ncbi:hypothetical protein Tco_0282975 [Tanacetum coccineum]
MGNGYPRAWFGKAAESEKEDERLYCIVDVEGGMIVGIGEDLDADRMWKGGMIGGGRRSAEMGLLVIVKVLKPVNIMSGRAQMLVEVSDRVHATPVETSRVPFSSKIQYPWSKVLYMEVYIEQRGSFAERLDTGCGSQECHMRTCRAAQGMRHRRHKALMQLGLLGIFTDV